MVKEKRNPRALRELVTPGEVATVLADRKTRRRRCRGGPEVVSQRAAEGLCRLREEAAVRGRAHCPVAQHLADTWPALPKFLASLKAALQETEEDP